MPQYYPSGGGVPAEHANAEVTNRGTTTSRTLKSSSIGNGGNVDTVQITTTKLCAIVIVAIYVGSESSKVTDIQRGGVNKTQETTISLASDGGYLHVSYAVEVMGAGTYTYDQVNTSGVSINRELSGIKLVAVGA